MTDDDKCGSTNTSSGKPCKNSAESCPWHDTDDPPETGRPTKLTLERQERIASMIEEGHSIGAAARSNGITVQTFFNWMERGAAQDEGVFAEFFERITRARGHGEKQYLDAIMTIARENGDVSTLLTLLKSRYPESWADAKRGEQTGGVTVNLDSTETVEIDPETLEIIDE